MQCAADCLREQRTRKTMPRSIPAAAFLLAAALAAPSARADVLFRNDPRLTDSLATTSDADQPQYSADDFSVGSATSTDYHITRITWWGRFSGTTVPDPGTSNFVLQLYRGASGPGIAPWLELALGAVSRSRAGTADGIALFEFVADLATPIAISGGERYYFSVFNDDGDAANPNFAILWSSTSGPTNPRWFRSNPAAPWTPSGSNANTAFQLEGTAVAPEPTSIALLGMGLAAIGIGRRARRRPST